MLKNDIKKDLDELVENGHWVKADLMSRMNLPAQYYSKITGRTNVNKKLIELLDIMGYDVEIRFVRKKR